MDEKAREYMDQPLSARRAALENFHDRFAARNPRLLLSPHTDSLTQARTWVKQYAGLDGLMAKDVGNAYQPGERVMRKYKFIRSADCVVAGFRYASGSALVGSLLLGLYDGQGLLHHVGFTSSIPAADKKMITRQLEAMRGGEGFSGNAPGGPSRWSAERSSQWEPLTPELVVEVSYDHVSDRRFRHGTKLLRFRPDKSPGQCTMEQLRQPPSRPL